MVVRLTVALVLLALAGGVRADLHVEVRAFGPGEVELSEGPYEAASARARKRVLAADPAALLAPFREAAGLPAKAKRLDSAFERDPKTAGRSLGHYLSALGALYAVTKDEDVKDRIWYVVEELYGCSLNNRCMLPVPAETAFDGASFHLQPQTAFAVLAGLHDAFRATGNRRAFDLLSRWVDWYQDCWRRMQEPARKQWLAGDWGGLNRAYLYVYNEFGRENYLHDGWNTFNQLPYFDELRKGKPDFSAEPPRALAAKLSGLYMRHRRTRWDDVHAACSAYLDYAMKTRGYAADDPDATVDLVWMAARLSEEGADGRLGDFIESRTKGLFEATHGPAAVDITDVFALKARENLFATSPRTLWVNQYASSRVTWADKGVVLSVKVADGRPGKATLSFEVKDPGTAFSLRLRNRNGRSPSVLVNGKAPGVRADPNGYTPIARIWKTGDTVDVSFPSAQ